MLMNLTMPPIPGGMVPSYPPPFPAPQQRATRCLQYANTAWRSWDPGFLVVPKPGIWESQWDIKSSASQTLTSRRQRGLSTAAN